RLRRTRTRWAHCSLCTWRRLPRGDGVTAPGAPRARRGVGRSAHSRKGVRRYRPIARARSRPTGRTRLFREELDADQPEARLVLLPWRVVARRRAHTRRAVRGGAMRDLHAMSRRLSDPRVDRTWRARRASVQ